jgi:small subunit ribosomal protein S16
MPVKIRLTRRGRKKTPYYHIVIADSRAPRDGRFIESIGTYNPITNPATIELNFDSALDWLNKGAQPTDTCRAILSYKGVMMKKHLLDGVKKKAFSDEEAETKFASWLKQKEEKIQTKRDSVKSSIDDLNKKRLEAEVKISDKRAEKIARKNAKLAAKEAGEQESEAGEQESVETEEVQQIEETAAVIEAPAEETPSVIADEVIPADTQEEDKKAEDSEV